MAEYNVEFLAGNSRQIENLLDLVSQIAVGNGNSQVKLLDLRRVVVDDKYWFVGFDFSVHSSFDFLC